MQYNPILFAALVLMLSIITIGSAAPIESRGIGSCYKRGKAQLTMYWIPKQGDKDMLNNGKVVTLNGSKNKSLKKKGGKTIEKVSSVTYEKFQMEGTGLLKSGKMVNLGESNNVFMEVNRVKTPFGLGDRENGLSPWTSVASNDIPHGTKLYIKELDGLKLPNGRTHNGCVKVEDKGWSFSGCQLDWFVLQYTAYKDLVDKTGEKIHAVQKNCKIKSYITKSTERWAVIR